MNSFQSSQNRLLMLLLFSAALFFAQTLNLTHDLEHNFHEQQSSCSVYLALDSHSDVNVCGFDAITVAKDRGDTPNYLSPVSATKKSSFAIRAPPKYLQS